jgi:hypothetical protein
MLTRSSCDPSRVQTFKWFRNVERVFGLISNLRIHIIQSREVKFDGSRVLQPLDLLH